MKTPKHYYQAKFHKNIVDDIFSQRHSKENEMKARKDKI